MISRAQARSAPRAIRQYRAIASPTAFWQAPSIHRSLNPKFLMLAGILSFITLIVVVITHLGTYSVALTRSTAQVDIQSTVQVSRTTSQAVVPTTNASKNLIRIDQTSVSQYNDQQEHDTWWASACSAASITEVVNAYGHTYKLTDILKVESGIGAITADQGLLYPEGIDQTAARFGFETQTLSNPTLDQVLSIANGGKPVIVNFPPETWTGGHFLVVIGSSTINGIPYIHLADSSALDMQYMLRDRFLSYWKGLAKVLTPKASTTPTGASTSQYAIAGKPTLSANFINQVLASYNSPAQGKGQALYDLGIQDGIDPAFALAFFFHESTLGTSGEAATTHSLGNLRCIPNAACINTAGQTCQPGDSCYAGFPTWEAGFQAWYTLIKQGYIQGHINQTIGQNACPCVTVAQIIPVYAPTSDNNDEQAYISSLKHSLDVWHSGQLRP